MKLLHTADWHLADRLGRIDRTSDLRRAVEQIASYCEQLKVDVLLVAGDLFSELARPEGLRESIRHLQSTFEPFLRSGGTILAITGNHDNESFCQTLRHAMTLASPTVGAFGDVAPPGRLYLSSEPSLLRLKDSASGSDIQFVLLPYPTPSVYLTNAAQQGYTSFGEKVAFLQTAFAERLREIRSDARFDPRLATVLMAHINVRGAKTSSLFRISESEDVVFSDDSLHEQYAYVALGHIHKPQAIGGHENVRYSGSIDRLDLGEQNDTKGVVLIELNSRGLVASPETLPLDATPIAEVHVTEPQSELSQLAEQYSNCDRLLANLHIHYTPGVDSLEEVLRNVESTFPRWYARDWTENNALGATLTVAESRPSRSFHETVREYLSHELQNHVECDEIVELAEQLMTEMDNPGAAR